MLEMACEKEMASCVRGYHIHKDIWAAAIGEVLVCFAVKLYSRKKNSYVFCVRKYFNNEKKSKLRYIFLKAVEADIFNTLYSLFNYFSACSYVRTLSP